MNAPLPSAIPSLQYSLFDTTLVEGEEEEKEDDDADEDDDHCYAGAHEAK